MEGDPRNPKTSLLKKYDIPVDHLSYEYIEKCSDKRELERIIRILRSGEEGCYPDLLRVTEERLALFAPDSRVLRQETPILTKDSLSPDEWKSVESELLSWEQEMSVIDKSLDFEKGRKDIVGSKSMPSIRKVVEPKQKKSEKILTKNTPSDRIKSGDYAAWDKFDVDKALLKIDIEEEREQEQNQRKKRELKKAIEEKKIDIDLDKDSYSSMEQQVLANQAKDRGNECYKSGDLVNALKYYNLSIKLHSTSNAYNNRAMTYLKLKQYENAVKDCNVVLNQEKDNIKALHRRATAYQNMANDSNNFNMLALNDLSNVVLLEPNNKIAQAELQKLKTKLGVNNVGKKFRMPIYECDPLATGDVMKSSKTNDIPNSSDKLPLTYYGPSTSAFQCEPYGMVHRALCGSLSTTEVVCKCNSNVRRQNPLCQKCGEAMCTPKPVSKPSLPPPENKENRKASNDAKNIKQKLESQNRGLQPDSESDSCLKKVEALKSNKEIQNEASALCSDSKTKQKEDKLSQVVSEQATITSETGKNSSEKNSNRIINHLDLKNRDRQNAINESKKEEEIKNSQTEKKAEAPVVRDKTKEPRQDAVGKQNSGKSKSKKKKSKERQKESKIIKEIEMIEPRKVVHADKYLHPTSVEPKVKVEAPEKQIPEMNRTKETDFKAFVPNRQCLSIRRDDSLKDKHLNLSGSSRKPAGYEPVAPTTFDLSKSPANEGNKENFLTPAGNGSEKSCHVVESAYEFVKTWEEVKKLDPNYSKRAEIIRLIRPTDLGKVIGIKLDSDMLSSILECLEKQFVETDPKIVVEFMNQLPRIPRFGLIKMFLADADKNKMINLIRAAENKGFVLEEEVKKALAFTS
ncbi:hypothetical protein RUM44_005182 [Polyplax serrata]|uniref:RNA-polymerase II-associated protein 3-like C-terminal domain-containing protein n=1 Tax=Polyplax serrata TaxID=468196 RepID=A0ABR1AEA5_POLSC